jgi:glycosyltransferase involved in cell wall biosynthesis
VLFSPTLGLLRQYPARALRIPAGYFETKPPKDPPLVSIVTPSFNQGQFLEWTLRSVVDQAYPRLEYVVQDGGSSDQSPSILHRYRAALASCESGPDHGQAHALNRGFRHTRGEILAYLNADDLLLPGALAYIACFFRAHPEIDVVYGHRILIDANGDEIGRWVLPPHDDRAFLWRDFIPQETLFWRRGIWERTGAALDEALHFALDWDLLLRFRRVRARFARLPRFLGAFRIHTGQKTSALSETVGHLEIDRVRQRWHGRSISEQEVDSRVRPYVWRHVACQGLSRLGLLRY